MFMKLLLQPLLKTCSSRVRNEAKDKMSIRCFSASQDVALRSKINVCSNVWNRDHESELSVVSTRRLS